MKLLDWRQTPPWIVPSGPRQQLRTFWWTFAWHYATCSIDSNGCFSKRPLKCFASLIMVYMVWGKPLDSRLAGTTSHMEFTFDGLGNHPKPIQATPTHQLEESCRTLIFRLSCTSCSSCGEVQQQTCELMSCSLLGGLDWVVWRLEGGF